MDEKRLRARGGARQSTQAKAARPGGAPGGARRQRLRARGGARSNKSVVLSQFSLMIVDVPDSSCALKDGEP
jgi:hypothetical protein